MSEQLLHQRRFPTGSSERVFEIEVPSVFELKLSNADTEIQHLDSLLHPVLSDLERDRIGAVLAASLQAGRHCTGRGESYSDRLLLLQALPETLLLLCP